MYQFSALIEHLRSLVNEEKLLTDEEDLYVYSFEKIFSTRNFPNPKIVIRVLSNEELEKICDWAEKENINVICRSRSNLMKIKEPVKPYLLLDDIKQPNFIEVAKKNKENSISKDYLQIEPKNIHSIHNNTVLAVKKRFNHQEVYRCMKKDYCHGYCSISPSFNEIETWSAKGRMLLIRAVLKGELPISNKFIDILYTCSTCGHCFAECFSGLEFSKAILSMRHLIVKKKLIPNIFLTLGNNITKFGDPGGFSIKQRAAWFAEVPSKRFPEKAEILYWIGCMVANRTPETAKSFYNILNNENIDFTLLKEDEGCCGYILLSTGQWEDAKKVAIGLLEKIKKTNAQKVITPCAGCYYTFTKLYPEILGINLPFEVLHSSQFLESIIHDLSFNPLNASIAYHDPCSLGRHCKVYEAPRNVLNKIPGLKIKELLLNRDQSRCCGGGGGLWTYKNNISLNTASIRLINDLNQSNIDILTTACPICNMNFRITSKRKKIPLLVKDITELVEAAIVKIKE